MLPQRLLPRTYYKFINTYKILGKKCLLIRRSRYKDVLDSANCVKPSAVCDLDASGIEAFGLSMCIIGVFKVEDLIYNCGIEKWKLCMRCDDVTPKEIFNSSEYEPIVAYIDDLDGIPFTYKDAERLKKSKEWESIKGNSKKSYQFLNKLFNGRTQINHAPLIKNYWHFEWHFIDQYGERFPPRSSRSKILAQSIISSYILKYFKLYNSNLQYSKVSFWSYILFIPCFLQKLFKQF